MEFLYKLIDLAYVYGFTLVFSVCATVLLGWVIKITLGHLLSSSKNKDILITNHLNHLTAAVTGSQESVEDLRTDVKDSFELLRSDIKDGFGQLAGTFEVGLQRQERLMGEVLKSRCPLLKDDVKK
jgi:hypothetical protein